MRWAGSSASRRATCASSATARSGGCANAWAPQGNDVNCPHPIPFETLVAYWVGELPEAEEAPLEEHVFSCAYCARRMEELAALGEGIRAAVRAGKVGMVISA